MDLKDKVVVITGASRGLGRALTMRFFKEGAKLILGSRSEKELQEIAVAAQAKYAVVDVKVQSDLQKLSKLAIENFDRIDIWVNNAGIIIPPSPVENIDLNKFKEMIEVNLLGTVYGSIEAAKKMKIQKSGIIINMASIAGLEGKEGLSAYCATKFAVSGFTKSIRLETSPFNIKVICVYPGGIKTHLFDEKKPENYEYYMDVNSVAKKIIENIKKENLKEELVIRRRK